MNQKYHIITATFIVLFSSLQSIISFKSLLILRQWKFISNFICIMIVGKLHQYTSILKHNKVSKSFSPIKSNNFHTSPPQTDLLEPFETCHLNRCKKTILTNLWSSYKHTHPHTQFHNLLTCAIISGWGKLIGPYNQWLGQKVSATPSRISYQVVKLGVFKFLTYWSSLAQPIT